MGRPRLGSYGKVDIGTQSFAGVAVDVGNPHLACVVDDLTPEALTEFDLGAPITFDHRDFPTA